MAKSYKTFKECSVGDLVYVAEYNALEDCNVGIAKVLSKDGDVISIDYNGEMYRSGESVPFGDMLTFYSDDNDTITVYADYEYFALIMDTKSREYTSYYLFYKTANSIAQSIELFMNLEPFTSPDDIPDVPHFQVPNVYKEVVVANLKRCGAIPKEELEVGAEYIGSCRNADKALWTGREFIYQRSKFGSTYTESVEHFDSDTIFDVFVPIKKVNK